MQKFGVLTLLSDFGSRDAYVGVMKGAIAHINPDLNVIDLTHQIPPQDIAAARFALMTAFPFFPVGTVHVAVVDPGVGSLRRAIAIALGTDLTQPAGYLVGPDNGIFSGVLSQFPILAAVELTNSHFWRTPEPSQTFHGRDIFAPVGAHLASGVSIPDLGREIAPATLVQRNPPTCLQTDTSILGSIQATDHFGSLITTIPASVVDGKSWWLKIGDRTLPGKHTYSDRPPGELVALIGSHGWIEIAVHCGNAQTLLGHQPDLLIEVSWN